MHCGGSGRCGVLVLARILYRRFGHTGGIDRSLCDPALGVKRGRRRLRGRTPEAQQNQVPYVLPLKPPGSPMFRPDPNGPHSLKEVIANLGEVLRELPADSPRARTLADMIRRFGKAETDSPLSSGSAKVASAKAVDPRLR